MTRTEIAQAISSESNKKLKYDNKQIELGFYYELVVRNDKATYTQ